MEFKVNFNSEELIYMQLCNQIIYGIATSKLHEGDMLPSCRIMADIVGINMHTVNKAYTTLCKMGVVQSSRKGTVIIINKNKAQAINNIRYELEAVLAKCKCFNITKKDIYSLVDENISKFQII